MTRELRALPVELQTVDLDGLQNLHSEMLATASDLGFEPPASTLVEVVSVEQGVPVVTELHGAIKNFLAGVGEKEHKSGEAETKTEPKKTSKKQGSKKSSSIESPQQAMARQKAAREARDAAKTPAAESVKTVKESKVAKKAKKAVKKVAKKKAASNARTPAVDDTKKISWVFKGEGNGARKETERWERREVLRKANGATVKTYLAKGGSIATLNRAVKDGAVKLA